MQAWRPSCLNRRANRHRVAIICSWRQKLYRKAVYGSLGKAEFCASEGKLCSCLLRSSWLDSTTLGFHRFGQLPY